MSHVWPSRVRESTGTVGVGAYVLAGAVTGFRAFSEPMVDGDTVDATITRGADYEIGRYTYMAGTLQRTAIFRSSNADAAVNWGAGSKEVFAGYVGFSDLDATGEANLGTLLGTIGAYGTPNAGEYGRWTGSAQLEGRTVAQVRSDLSLVVGTNVQAYSDKLAALAALTWANGKLIRLTGTTTLDAIDLDTDGTFAANSDSKVASQKATRTYAEAYVAAYVAAQVPAATTSAAGKVELATLAEYRIGTDTGRVPAVDQLWASLAEVTLTDAATIAVDMSTFFDAVVTLGGNRTLGNPSNTKVGQKGRITIIQDGSGGRTLAYASNWKFPGGVDPTLSTAIGAKDVLFYDVRSSTEIFANLAKAYA